MVLLRLVGQLAFLAAFVGKEMEIASSAMPWTVSQLIPPAYDLSVDPLSVELDRYSSLYGRARSHIQPIRVGIRIGIVEFLDVDDSQQTITLDLKLHEEWRDARLNYPPPLPSGVGNESDARRRPVTLDSTWASKIWKPKLSFLNAVSGHVLRVLSPNERLFLYPAASGRNGGDIGGHVALGSRLTVKFRCDMNLYRYPHDVQYCDIQIASLTQPVERLLLEWEELSLSPDINYPKLTLRLSGRFANCSGARDTQSDSDSDSQDILASSMSDENYSCLRGQILLSRRLAYYVIRYYGPSFLIVITAFVGFWLPVLAWPARIAIIITPLLTLVTQQSGLSAEISVHYVCALHIWMGTCQFFVFACLIEYALAIGYAHQVQDRKEQRKARNNAALIAADSDKSAKTKRRITFILDERNEAVQQERIHCSYDMTGQRRSPSRATHCLNGISRRIFGRVDWRANPLDRNPIDYAARLLFPLAWLTFVAGFIVAFVLPWSLMKK